ncbi:MAG: hypothetical protein ACXAB4_01855 [Candidatus Hodarchaeales archaeon]
MREVKRKILVLGVALLFLAMLATPVMATSPKKIPVTITTEDFVPSLATDVWTSGNVIHGRGAILQHLTFIIEGDGMPTLTGSSYSIQHFDVNTLNGHGSAKQKVTFTFPGGTFEGHRIRRGLFVMMGPPGNKVIPIHVEGVMHAVFRGTGDYLGWTLVVTKPPGEPREAYMLIP